MTCKHYLTNSLADPGDQHGARPRNGRGSMIFYAANANGSLFFSREPILGYF